MIVDEIFFEGFDRLSVEVAKRLGSTEVSDEAPVLKSFDLVGAMEYLKNCSNIIVMTGAGISTSAGIPDFRTPGTGLYSQMENYNLSDPQDVFHIDFFRVDYTNSLLTIRHQCLGFRKIQNHSVY